MKFLTFNVKHLPNRLKRIEKKKKEERSIEFLKRSKNYHEHNDHVILKIIRRNVFRMS